MSGIIGGYICRTDAAAGWDCLSRVLHGTVTEVTLADSGLRGYLFYRAASRQPADETVLCKSDSLLAMSPDLLVGGNWSGGYERLDMSRDFEALYKKYSVGVFGEIVSDCRTVVVDLAAFPKTLYLVSNRAGSGRMYYERTETGLAFCSDIRVLLAMGQHEVNDVALYAIMKYGAVPEPMTISKTISAVPVGHYARFDLKEFTVETKPYFKFRFAYDDTNSPRECDVSVLASCKNVLRASAQFLGKQGASILMGGGIDSTLLAHYMGSTEGTRTGGFACSFGNNDRELDFARSAAESSSVELHVVTLRDSDVIRAVQEAALLSGHPYADYSVVPITFTLSRIPKSTTGSRFIIEGNGGDDCFGFPTLARRAQWEFVFGLPGWLKNAATVLLLQGRRWEKGGKVTSLLRAIAKGNEMDIALCPLVRTPVNRFLIETQVGWDESVSAAMLEVFRNCGENWSGTGFYGESTVAQIVHICSRLWSAKALVPGDDLGWNVVYPYLWRDVLVEQGKLPWTCKVYQGEMKWALKKLLEEFMPREFIYRKKAGFTPPFGRWLAQKEFNQYVRDVLCREQAIITRIVSRRAIERLLNACEHGKPLSIEALYLLWAALFTELWIGTHWRQRVPDPRHEHTERQARLIRRGVAGPA